MQLYQNSQRRAAIQLDIFYKLLGDSWSDEPPPEEDVGRAAYAIKRELDECCNHLELFKPESKVDG